eukprot:355470_1
MGNKQSKLQQSAESIIPFDVVLLYDEKHLIKAFIRQNTNSLQMPLSLYDIIQSYFQYSNADDQNTGWWMFNRVSCKPFLEKQKKYHQLMQFNVKHTDISLVISGKYEKTGQKQFGVIPADLKIYCGTIPTMKKLNIKYIIFYYELTTKTYKYGSTYPYEMRYKRGIVFIKDTDKNDIKMYKRYIGHNSERVLICDGGFFEKRSLFIDILHVHYDVQSVQKHFIRFNHVGTSYEYHTEFMQKDRFSERFGENALFYLEFACKYNSDEGDLVRVALHCNYMGILHAKICSKLNTEKFMEDKQYENKFNGMDRSVFIHKFRMKNNVTSKRVPTKFKIALRVDILKHTPLCQFNSL